MADMSPSQAKQATAKSVADVFGPLEDDAIASLKHWLSPVGRHLEPQRNVDSIKIVLDKLYGKTPEQTSASEPKWMQIVRKSVSVDGIPLQNLPGVSESLNGRAEIEEVTFEFVWDEAG